MRRLSVVLVAMLVVVGVLVARDPVFWDRYLHAYTFATFVAHPFPKPERLYPQETVQGADSARTIAHRALGASKVNRELLEAATEFAAAAQSTSLIVYHQGAVELEQYWLGADANTPLYSFSMHKSVVALLVGIAIDEGHIKSVDEPLANYLSEWVGQPQAAITIRNALQMNSGFETMIFPRHPFSKHVRRQIGTDLTETALSFELVEAPGTTFSYNGVNPTLLVLLIERATGRRYADYLSEKLWRPLGNRDAAVWLDHENGLARGATSLYATAMDWLRIGQLILNDGRVGDRQLVSQAWLEAMTTPSPTNPTYGLLTWIGTDYAGERSLESFEGFAAVSEAPFLAGDLVYFDGLGGQRVYIIPSQQLIIVRTGVMAHTWEDEVLPNLLFEAVVPAAKF